MKRGDILRFIISIIICQLAGLVGSIFTAPAIPTWYVTLNKPFFTPPSSIFAPVWITLYVLMGIAFFLVWRRGFDSVEVAIAMRFFIIQLILNAMWSVVFFGLKSPLGGFIVIIILWIFILITIINFFKITKIAGILLIPYIAWVSFAAVLNFSLYRLNL